MFSDSNVLPVIVGLIKEYCRKKLEFIEELSAERREEACLYELFKCSIAPVMVLTFRFHPSLFILYQITSSWLDEVSQNSGTTISCASPGMTYICRQVDQKQGISQQWKIIFSEMFPEISCVELPLTIKRWMSSFPGKKRTNRNLMKAWHITKAGHHC